MSREVQTQTIECQDESGNRHTVIEFQNIVELKTLEGTSYGKGLKRLALPNGHPVNRIDNDTFDLVLEEIQVSRITP